MGYTTSFEGTFRLNRPLNEAQKNYLQRFAETRHMKRDEAQTALLPDPIREAVGLPVGNEGQYYVGGDVSTVIDHNNPPEGQPGLWCDWIPTDDGAKIVWNGGEKFYHYVTWLQYLINHFLAPSGFLLNGTVTWQGEEHGDVGRIIVTENKVHVEMMKPEKHAHNILAF